MKELSFTDRGTRAPTVSFLKIEFRNGPSEIPGQSFFGLVKAFRTGAPVPPIEVRSHAGNYVIMNGVRRALAAKAAGREYIDAILISARAGGGPIGHTVPLSEVLFPHDLRAPEL